MVATPDYLSLWDGCFYLSESKVVEVYHFAAYFPVSLNIIRYFFCTEGEKGDRDVINRRDYFKLMRWWSPFINDASFKGKLEALYASLRAQNVTISLRDRGNELMCAEEGTYYIRYSESCHGALTLELRPPTVGGNHASENYRIMVTFDQMGGAWIVRYSFDGNNDTPGTINGITADIIPTIEREYQAYWRVDTLLTPLRPPKIRRNYRLPNPPEAPPTMTGGYHDPDEYPMVMEPQQQPPFSPAPHAHAPTAGSASSRGRGGKTSGAFSRGVEEGEEYYPYGRTSPHPGDGGLYELLQGTLGRSGASSRASGASSRASGIVSLNERGPSPSSAASGASGRQRRTRMAEKEDEYGYY